MKCYFCGKFCKSYVGKDPYGLGVRTWICSYHQTEVMIRWDSNTQYHNISFKFFYQSKEYKIIIYPNTNASRLMFRNAYDSFSNALRLNSILKITPENYHQKIPTLLTFS